MKRRLSYPSRIAFLILIIGACSLWFHAQQRRQYAQQLVDNKSAAVPVSPIQPPPTLNQQLIDALIHQDNWMALTLVNAGADPNTRIHTLTHGDSPTAFMLVCGAMGYYDDENNMKQIYILDDAPLAQAMLKHGAKDQGALFWALQCGRINTVRVLLQNGVDANEKYESETPLMIAVSHDNLELSRLLLQAGADINAKDNYGRTPLMYALEGRADTVRFLLQHKAHLNTRDNYGETVLTLAEENPDIVDIITLLKHAGARN